MALNIVVCVKSVMLGALPGKNRRASENMELNPFDLPALALGISLARAHNGTVTVVSMGPQNATFGLYQALSMGADKAILICDPALKESDTYVTATVLGNAIKQRSPFDLVLFGTRSSDSDTGHVGPQTAEMLNLPFIGHLIELNVLNIASEQESPFPSESNITDGTDFNRSNLQFTPASSSLSVSSSSTFEKKPYQLRVKREVDGYLEAYELSTPALFSIDASAMVEDSLHLTTLYGIDDAFEHHEIEFMDINTLGMTSEETGLSASPTKIVAWNRKKKGKSCRFIEGTPEQKADQLVKQLIASGFVG